MYILSMLERLYSGMERWKYRDMARRAITLFLTITLVLASIVFAVALPAAVEICPAVLLPVLLVAALLAAFDQGLLWWWIGLSLAVVVVAAGSTIALAVVSVLWLSWGRRS